MRLTVRQYIERCDADRATAMAQIARLWANQRLFSPGQKAMAMRSHVLVWIVPKRTPMSKELRLKIGRRDNFICHFCELQLDEKTFTVDHLHPYGDGGTDDEGNLVCCCRPCNSSKGMRTPEEWRR